MAVSKSFGLFGLVMPAQVAGWFCLGQAASFL